MFFFCSNSKAISPKINQNLSYWFIFCDRNCKGNYIFYLFLFEDSAIFTLVHSINYLYI